MSAPIFIYRDYDHARAQGDDVYPSWSGSIYVNKRNDTCPYCKIACHNAIKCYWRFSLCRRCGWWSYEDGDENPKPSRFHDYEEWARAVLLKFSIDDTEIASNELAQYLIKHEEQLSAIHPIKFEELVADIFRDVCGNVIEHCSYGRPDRGIDVVCLNLNNGKRIGVQVKRYSHPIRLSLIQQFAGALLDNDLRAGTFVTSGSFQSGCHDVAVSVESKSGIQIDLVDGRRFLEFLNLFWDKHSSTTLPLPEAVGGVTDLFEVAKQLGLGEPFYK